MDLTVGQLAEFFPHHKITEPLLSELNSLRAEYRKNFDELSKAFDAGDTGTHKKCITLERQLATKETLLRIKMGIHMSIKKERSGRWLNKGLASTSIE